MAFRVEMVLVSIFGITAVSAIFTQAVMIDGSSADSDYSCADFKTADLSGFRFGREDELR